MKRHLCIVAVFLLLGATVNVAVAWGFAVWSRNDDFGSWEPATKWPHPVPNDWPPPQDTSRSESFGVDRLGVYWEELPTPSDLLQRLNCVIETTQAGWPLRTLEGVEWRDIRWVGSHEWHMWSIDYHISLTESSWDFLPLKPIWPGFAVNSILYAAVLWLLIPGPFVLRRFVRMKRGRCVKCAYPMGESDVCSECGKALPGRAEAAT